jgi:DNA-binding winged helix-turn-helix (wHTH) protein
MRVSFGGFTLDGETRQLSDGTRPVHLSPKAFGLLVLLVERRPAVVPKGEIVRRIWPDVSVSETSLVGLVKEIRRALGDDAAEPAIIRTAHAVGYAFIGRVDGEATRPAPATSGSYRCWLTSDDRTFSLAPGENVIGRDPRSAVWIDAAGVSRRHARIVVAEGEAVVEDLGSRNGTTVGDEPVTGPRRLEDGDPVCVGATTLTFRQWSEERAPLTEPIGPRARSTRSSAKQG